MNIDQVRQLLRGALTPVAATSLIGLGACATGSVNQAQMTETQAAIRGAQEVGADDAPQAALHLQYAKEQLADAETIADDDPERANRLLMRAESDAELAIALAEEAELRTEAEETRNRIREEREQHL
ncbi:MAG: DUF4398 domain-containing protein [Deltaproteobacteria bacterium]|nr:DUF4398 domain-containing protein [Deltaproteobacteria bacterium]